MLARSTPTLACLVAVVALSATPVGAQTLTPEEQAELDAAIAADSGPTPTPKAAPAVVGSANPNISLILDTALAWFNVDEPDQLGAHDPNETGFVLQQVELHMDASVDHVFRFDANLVFGLFNVEVEEAFATTLGLPAGLQVRAGQFFTRVGRVNSTHPHAWDFLDQPLVLGKFYGGESNRGLGLELSWLAPLPWYLEVVTSVQGATGDCCARSFYGGSAPPARDPRDLLTTVAIKQFHPLSDSVGLKWGLNFQTGPNASGAGNRTEIYAIDAHLRWATTDAGVKRSLTLQSELFHRRRQAPDTVLADTGLYAQLVYQHDKSWAFGGRFEWVEGLVADPLDPEWATDRLRSTLQATYSPSHFSRLRLQGSVDDPGGDSPAVVGLMLGLEVLIGSHPSHSY